MKDPADLKTRWNGKGEKRIIMDDKMANNPVREVTIERTLNAPRDLVWKAWTDPKIVAKWWGPRGVTNPTCEVDARPGGKMYIVMLAGKELGPAAGMKWPMVGTFKEVKPQSRLVIIGGAADEAQKIFLESEITVDFRESNGKTSVNVHVMVTKINNAERALGAIKGMEMGWNQQMDKLVEMLAIG